MRRSPFLSLFGAYVPHVEPRAPKPLVVDIYGFDESSAVLRGAAKFAARVYAEDLAVSAPATARLVRPRGGAELRVTFTDVRGATNDIVVERRRKAGLARSLTELSGVLLGAGGSAVAAVQLRINWRLW